MNCRISPSENFVLSGAAAFLSKTTAAPVERVKILLQNQGELVKQGVLDRPYRGVANCTLRVARNDGILSFWRGNWANCIRYIPTQALNFTFKDSLKSLFPLSQTASYSSKLFSNTMAGGLAGALTLVVVYPLDFARNRLGADVQNKDGKQVFRGLTDVYRQIWATDGIKGLYRGFTLGVLGIFIYRAIYFGVYDTAKPYLEAKYAKKLGFLESFSLGYGVTLVASILPYPTDTVRRRMMMTSGTGDFYSNSFTAAREMIRNEGLRTVYKGFSANILRSLAGGLVLASADEIKLLYVNLRYPSQ